MRPFRVVFIDHVARMSGGEIALLRLVPALHGVVEAHVILGEDGPLVDKLRDAGATVEVLPLAVGLRDTRRDEVQSASLDPRSVILLLRYVWRLRRRLRQLRPDLVHTNSLKAALYGGLAGRLAHVPVLWHVRDRIADDYLPRPVVWLVRGASRFLPTAVVANSSSTLATVPQARRGSVLYNPVVPDVIPENLWVRAGSGPLHTSSGPLRVAVVGRLAEWKGQHVFLDAFAEAFADGGAEARLIGSAMFGEEHYEGALRVQAQRLGISRSVVFCGFQPDVSAELEKLDVLVHCSTSPEPFGQVVVEGMAAGLAVVAAAAGGPLEIIDDGRDGLLTPPGDARALAEALRRLARDPALRARLGNAARESSQRFNPQAARDRLVAVYDDVTRGRLRC